MVQSIIDIGENEDRILNIVKAKFGFKNKSQAVSMIAQIYGESFLEFELRPEYLEKLMKISKGKHSKVFNSIEELDLHTETELGRNTLIFGTKNTTYMNLAGLKFSGVFSPTYQDYAIYSKFNMPSNNLETELYAYHNCFHPINKEYLIVTKDGEDLYGVYSTGETRMGVKIKF